MSTPATSPRGLALQHGVQSVKPVTPCDITAPPEIGPGNERLFSFYAPGLVAGSYQFDVTQTIANGSDKLPDKKSSQSFKVVAPQYTLPAHSFNSTFPAAGHAAPDLTLPHIVLNGPQLPWERLGSVTEQNSKDPPIDLDKTRTPWMAVLVFTHDEITLPPDALKELNTLFPVVSPAKPLAPSPTCTYNVNMSSFISTIKKSTDTMFSTPLPDFDKTENDPTKTRGDVVFVESGILTELFRSYDNNGQKVASDNPDVSRYRWLAHVRQVDTTGMAKSGAKTGPLGEKDSLLSVVLSHRTGPLGTTQPTPVVAHLVSIEGIEGMKFPFQTPYVALTSLYSWSYMSLPPSSLTVHDAFEHVGTTATDPFCSPLPIGELANLKTQGTAGESVATRITNGYSLTRYRVQTGELTAAFYRGPLTPVNVPYPLRSGWNAPSTHGTNRQIFDKDVGMMDVSYSAAWQLGRTLALADRSFTVALARVRQQIQNIGVEAVKKEKMQQNTMFRTKGSTIQTLTKSMSLLGILPQSDLLLVADASNRWQAEPGTRLDISFKALSEDGTAADRDELQNQLNTAAEQVSGTLQDATIPYDEFNTPYSTDWVAVLKWVMDRMYLTSLPAHYLINDPSYLPLETIRSFAIDRNWTDSLIDGALSLANHLERSDDMVRRAIRHALQRYLSTTSTGLGRLPPVPMYGFLLRSELVTMFPDLVVKTLPTPLETQPVLIRHVLLDTNVMFCLFDRPPTKGSFESISLTQPPHQPCFSAASVLTAQQIQIEPKAVYTGDIGDQPKGQTRMHQLPIGKVTLNRGVKPTAKMPVLFTWDTDDTGSSPYSTNPALRFLNTNAFANWSLSQVTTGMDVKGVEYYTETIATSSLVAYQLNEPSWQLDINLQLDSATPPVKTGNKTPPKSPPIKTESLSGADSGGGTGVITSPPPAVSLSAASPHQISTSGIQRSQPLVLNQQPPNVTVIPKQSIIHPSLPASIVPVAAPLAAGAPKGDPTAGAPVYNFRVFSIDPETNDDTLTPSRTPQDLVFSILLEDPTTIASFNVQRITIYIYFSNRDEVLATDYQGSGGFMTSNLRFNVVCSLVDKLEDMINTKLLRIDLFPRTHLNAVPAGNCLDMSFVLSSVVVADINKSAILKVPVDVVYELRNPIRSFIEIKRLAPAKK